MKIKKTKHVWVVLSLWNEKPIGAFKTRHEARFFRSTLWLKQGKIRKYSSK